MRTRKMSLMILLSFVFAIALVGCGGSKAAQPASSPSTTKGDTAPITVKPIELTIGHVVKTNDNFHAAALKFKETVETESKGQILVNIIPEGQAGPEKDLLSKTQSGELDGAITTAGSATSFVPELGLFDLPWLFDNTDHVHKVLDGPVGNELSAKIQSAGFMPIGVLDFGFRHLTNSQRPIMTPEDVKGLTVRVLPNAIYQGTWETVTGVKPMVLNWTEVPAALTAGQIDGQENPISILVSYKLWETQKYAAKTGHVFAVALFTMNPTKFNALNQEQQALIKKAGVAAVQESRLFLANAEQKGWETLKANGMTITEIDRSAFRRASLENVSTRFATQVPVSWLNTVLSTSTSK